MSKHNNIGIDKKMDWNRVRHLMKIGLFASFLVLIGDMLLGWNVTNPNKNGWEKHFSKYLTLSDSRIFWAGFLGLIGIPIEGLCYFSIYRLIAPYSDKFAHLFRSGVLGYIAFGGCGVHVPCTSIMFFYKYIHKLSPDTSINDTFKYGTYFLIPGTIAFSIFFFVQTYAHILAFSKGLTPYPKWCWIFCIPVGMLITIIPALIINYYKEFALINALTTGNISIGNIWMFGGLLLFMNKVKKNQ